MLSWLFGKKPSPSHQPFELDLLELPSKYFDGCTDISVFMSSERIARIGSVRLVSSGPQSKHVIFNDNDGNYMFGTKYYPTETEADTAMREIVDMLRSYAKGLPIRVIVRPWRSQIAA